MRPRGLPSLMAVVLVAAACAANPSPLPAIPAPAPAVHDVCEGAPPLAHAPLAGVLRNARCDQDLDASMGKVAAMLGVECAHCHAAEAGGGKRLDYPATTANKEIANWMSMHLMASIKPADGAPLQCSSCHTDEHGQPVAKILGQPRDRVKANEWMSLVMVKKFVAADGSRLKCRSCHAGTPGTPDFQPAVIRKSEQLPRHAVAGPGTPAF